MVGILQKVVNAVWKATHSEPAAESFGVDDLDPFNPKCFAGQTSTSPWEQSIFDGGKFAGGFGPTQLQFTDYWTLRARSSQLFTENLYARGIVRRLVTNIINTGLMPEASPDEELIGVKEDSLNDWTETVETRFGLWGKNARVCDYRKARTWGALQRAAYLEAIVAGDVLVIMRQSRQTKLPTIQLVSGSKVQNPLGEENNIRKGNKILHGVELDARGRVVAHWVKQDDNTTKRIAAFGEKTGRRLSWLVYGNDKRLDDVRGQPLLALVLQSLKEIDRYRDSTQRKAVNNSLLASFIKKTEDKMGTLPVTGGAVRRGSVTTTEDGEKRTFNLTSQLPGVVYEELQVGEEPVMMGGQGTDIAFGDFEEAIVQAVAWSIEIPPEILRLSFSNNYSASQAAINEFKISINMKWGDFGETFCSPIYVEWLVSETLLQKISAPGLLEAWRDPSQYDKFGAWVSADWYGSIKPSTDMLKQAKGSELMLKLGLTTHARESRVTTGTKYSQNIKRLKRENELKVEAMRPLAEFKREFGEVLDDETNDQLSALIDEHIEAAATDALDEQTG